jgi:ribose/xylose/arabinose/galactoside ABC-type transport system permease subunit
MRHLVGVILAIVMAAVLFFAASWGYLKLGGVGSGQARLGALPPGGGASLWHDRAVVEGFGALAATGLVAGILIAVPRISPLAAGLPGLVLLAWTGLYLSSARRAVQYIPLKTRPYGAGFEDLLFGGVLALAGLAMIIPLFIPSRWRRRYVAVAPSGPAAPEGDTTSYPDSQATQTMAGGSVFTSDWPATATRPQPRIDPKSQAPWGPAEYS